jgi:PAS domain S-box-containing protein
VLDTQGNILFCNDCLLKLTGWKIDEVLGKSWFDTFCSDAMRHLDFKVINRSVTRGLPPSNGESEIRTRSGEIRRIMWSNTLLRNADGSIAGFASIGEDVTEHRLAEAQSQKLLHDLEMANRELKDFAYIVSHDLKAPLRGIRSLVNWLYSDNFDKLDEHGREQLHLLENRVNRMQNLLEGILQYSRAGYKKDEQTWINIREIVEEVLEMLDPPGNIDIIIEGDLPVLMLDRTRAQEIFSNLIGNAIKFMDKPQGLIKISACPQNGFWQFSISDNGPGIPEKYHQKIFTIFQTLRSRDDFESTGIGLTIVKKIIEIYNGRIWLESEPGSGSTFYFTLPMPASLP